MKKQKYYRKVAAKCSQIAEFLYEKGLNQTSGGKKWSKFPNFKQIRKFPNFLLTTVSRDGDKKMRAHEKKNRFSAALRKGLIFRQGMSNYHLLPENEPRRRKPVKIRVFFYTTAFFISITRSVGYG